MRTHKHANMSPDYVLRSARHPRRKPSAADLSSNLYHLDSDLTDSDDDPADLPDNVGAGLSEAVPQRSGPVATRSGLRDVPALSDPYIELTDSDDDPTVDSSPTPTAPPITQPLSDELPPVHAPHETPDNANPPNLLDDDDDPPDYDPAPPVVELLDREPPAIRRPLALVAGRAYAVASLTVRTTITEERNIIGEFVRFNPPAVITESQQFVARDDGLVFDKEIRPLSQLGLDLRLPVIPPGVQLWSAAALQRFAAGERPQATTVFTQLADVLDRFMDFDLSLAPQRTMCELVACYILSTWFLDAFSVVGFLWLHGDHGAGKTHLLSLISRLAHLGYVVHTSDLDGPAKDLADAGAMLAFDDAESLLDPRHPDSHKRAMLLAMLFACSRRDSRLTLKFWHQDKGWVSRAVNTFGPRIFAATVPPGPLVADRAIVLPLVRTADRYRANADPLDASLWPHGCLRLCDDLWALAVSRLPELPAYESRVNERAHLSGRSLEPWRALLAVALWLDDQGLAGLWQRMNDLSVAYHAEQSPSNSGDLAPLVIRALCALAHAQGCGEQVDAEHPPVPHMSSFSPRPVGEGTGVRESPPHNSATSTSSTSSASSTSPGTPPGEFSYNTSAITEQVIQIVQDTEFEIDTGRINADRVGRLLASLRLRKDPDTSKRRWLVTRADLSRLCAAYHLPLPDNIT